MQTRAFCLFVINLVEIVQQIDYAYPSLPEDAILDTVGLATKYGHPPSQYQVVTEDGYVLTLYRLPGRSRIPILLMHGLLDSSDTWLARGNTSVAITLANNGFDVWLANSRGNRHSRRHKYFDPDSNPAFWQFSFHEMGYYDLPAIIDAILEETNASNLTAIGHSQGNTMFYVLGSTRKEYNSKVNMLIALAPVAYLHNVPPPISVLMQSSPAISQFVKTFGIDEIFGDNSTSGNLLHTVCLTPKTGYIACTYGLFFNIFGYDVEELEEDFYPILAAHYPAGGSAKSILHFLQIGHRKRFARFDYGREANRRIYNSAVPPAYRLDRVTMPVALLAARNDRVSSIRDVAILRRKLPNVVYYLENPRAVMNHADYMIGRNMPIYILPYIKRLLEKTDHF